MEALDSADQQRIVSEANLLNTLRQVSVGVALVLLVGSLVYQSGPLAYVRSAAWFAAGVLSLMHGAKVKRLGQPANPMSAVIYFLVAALPIVRQL